ncbi:GNAT family N-acetyltransferase [Paraburkholderia aspalathi]|nr:GNAT family N-acetyltransferase [Paraburkholderia aspalathi]
MSGIKAHNALLSSSDGSITLGRMGTLEVRLAKNQDAIEAAQTLRFRVFYDELGAKGGKIEAAEQRDCDRYDPVCDHLLVYDTALPGPDHKQIVGTYRLMRGDQARAGHGFYSLGEYDVQRLTLAKSQLNFLELGRSCVKPEYRSKRTVELLWQGIWAYCRRHQIDVMFGCASFHGAVPAAHALGLTFLHHHCRADSGWDVRALPQHYHPLDMMPLEAVNPKVALFSMPPLIKGYLRLGAMIGDGAVVDEAFGTTDVFIILPVERISSRYISYYGADADRFL